MGSLTVDSPNDTTSAELDKAVATAVEASPFLVDAGIVGRTHLLEALADALDADVEVLVEAADAETSLGRPRLPGEVARTSGQLRMFAKVLREGSYADATIDHANPDGVPVPIPDLRRYLVPVGPVAVFAASNFPFAFSVAGGDTASALAAGCPVVVKAHAGHPRTSALTVSTLRRAATAAGFPADVVQVVYGRQAGIDLLRQPAIRAAGFTGSVAGGRALFDVAVGRPDPIPFFGELGSLNAMVVTPMAAAARGSAIGIGLAQSFTLGTGQFCTKPGFVLLPAGADGEALITSLVQTAVEVPAHRMLTDRMVESYRTRVSELRGAAYATVLVDGSEAQPDAVAPTVVRASGADVLAAGAESPLLEECFGPTTVLVTYDGEAQLRALLESVPPSLTGTVHGETDDDVAVAALQILKATVGRVVWNGYPTGVAPTWAMQHGGPYPATTASATTSVGTAAITRFLTAVAFQDVPDTLLPKELQDANPLGIVRRVDGRLQVP
jgi:NADP-dependent aldehyde dehydrogenase